MSIDRNGLEVLQDAFNKKKSVYLSGQGLDCVFQTQIVGISEGYIKLINTVPKEMIRRFTSSSKFAIQAQMLRFESSKMTGDGLNIICTLDQLLVLNETRQNQRFPFESNENVICDFINPIDGITRINKKVLDMSAMGLSFKTLPSELYAPGIYLPDVKITIDKVPYTTTNTRVIYQRKLVDLSGRIHSQVGLKFEVASAP